MKITLHFVRHGQTMFNFEEKVQGWGDSFLTPLGIAGVERLGDYWKQSAQKFDRVYSSDSGRTLQTARTILGQMGVRHDIIPVEALREYNFGYYEGRDEALLEADLKTKGNVSFDQLGTDAELVVDTIATLDKEKKVGVTNTWFSETGEEYVTRLVKAANHIVNESLNLGHKEILVVSHGMSIAFLISQICPEDWAKQQFGGIANASVSTVEYHNGKFKLITFAEVKA